MLASLPTVFIDGAVLAMANAARWNTRKPRHRAHSFAAPRKIDHGSYAVARKGKARVWMSSTGTKSLVW